MYLKKVTIDNYRIFKGKHEFDFSGDANHNINVVFGPNSSGKSSLINAICWCLFNSETNHSLSQPLYNYESAINCSDSLLSVSVECNFLYGDSIINIKRESLFSINGEDIQFLNSNFDIILEDGSNISSLDYYWLDNSFPRSLIDFSIFDSRYCDSFFEDNEIGLQKIFYTNLKLNYLDNVIHNFQKSGHYFKKEVKSSSLHPMDIDYKLEVKRNEERCAEVKKDIQSCDNSIKEINTALVKYKKELESLNPDFKKMEYLKGSIDSNLKKMDKLRKEYYKLLLKISPVALIFGKFIESNNSFNDEGFENFMLKNPNLLNSRVYEDYYNRNFVLRQLNDIGKIKECKHHLMELENETSNLYCKMEEFSALLENQDSSFNVVQDKIKMLELEHEKLLHSKKSLKNELGYLNRNIRRLLQLLKKMEYDRPFFESNVSKYGLCMDAISLGNDLKEEVMKHALLNFNDILNNIFINDLKMDLKFMKVAICDDFKIQLTNNYDKTVNLNDLSYVDKLILILSLLIAIREYFEIDYPLILIDPFVYLDGENRNNIIKRLVSSDSINQLILVLNESQYSDNVKINLFKKMATEYELNNCSERFKVIKHGL